MPRTNKEGKNTRKAMVSPSSIQIAWAAGFYEGEGNCCTQKSKNGGSQIVRIGQIHQESLMLMQHLFGGTITMTTRSLRVGCKPVYTWRICSQRARGFLMTIYKFLTPYRRDQVRQCLTIHKEAR